MNTESQSYLKRPIPLELVNLQIRNAISNKEMVVEMAKRDTAFGDGWRCDYAAWHGEISKEIDRLMSIISAPWNNPDL